MNRSRIVCALAAGLLFHVAAARGESVSTKPTKVNSVSGQFVVTAFTAKPWYYRPPEVSTNDDVLRLDAPLLAISAERFKSSLWNQIGLPPNTPWTGKIFLNLYPAASLDENIVIASEPFFRIWNYRADLPDIIRRNRFIRAMSAVLLLEIANRNVPVSSHPAAIPTWLSDGLAWQIVGAGGDQIILSTPTKSVNGLPMTRFNKSQRGIDPLARARTVLQNSPALTFDQLSWPDNAQLTGGDGDVYLASVQLFVARMLELPQGEAKLRNMLARLPACENWQTAFYQAFKEDFQRPLDVEKWWSLQVVNFANRDPGPRWMTAIGRQKLDALLLVPVDIRYQTNAWPVHTDISLQAALRQVNPQQLADILSVKLRDLQLVQLRLTPDLASLAAGYCDVLADFLGEPKPANNRTRAPKHASNRQTKASVTVTIKKLDALDQQRDKIESNVKSKEFNLPGN